MDNLETSQLKCLQQKKKLEGLPRRNAASLIRSPFCLSALSKFERDAQFYIVIPMARWRTSCWAATPHT